MGKPSSLGNISRVYYQIPRVIACMVVGTNARDHGTYHCLPCFPHLDQASAGCSERLALVYVCRIPRCSIPRRR